MKHLILAISLLLAVTAAVAEQHESEPAEAPDSRSLSEAIFCADIEERAPIGGAESFVIGDRVYFWNRIAGGEEGDGITHVWFLGEYEVQSIDLSVNGSPWRTWSYKTLFPGLAGNWRVEVRSAAGRVLGSYSFHCGE